MMKCVLVLCVLVALCAAAPPAWGPSSRIYAPAALEKRLLDFDFDFGIAESITTIITEVGLKAYSLVAAIASAAKTVLEQLAEIKAAVSDFLEQAKIDAEAKYEERVAKIKELVKSILIPAIDKATEVVLAVVEKILDIAASLLERLGGASQSLIDTIASILNRILDGYVGKVLDIVQGVLEYLDSLDNMDGLKEEILDLVRNTIEPLVEELKEKIESILKTVNARSYSSVYAPAAIEKRGIDFGIAELITTIITEVGLQAYSLVAAIASAAKTVLEQLAEIKAAVSDFLEQAKIDAEADIEERVAKIKELVKSILIPAIDKATEVVLAVVEKILDIAANLLERLGGASQSLIDTIASILNRILDGYVGKVLDIVQGVLQYLDSLDNMDGLKEEILDMVRNVIEPLVEQLKDKIDSVLKTV